jgi:lysozyme
MKIGEKGSKLIKHYEGLHDGNLKKIGLQAKLCPAGVWTVGWGHAIVHNKKMLKGTENEALANELYKDLTIEQADQLFIVDIQMYENQVNSLKLNLNQDQFDALVSFAYNCGFKNLLTSTLLKRIRLNIGDIPDAFTMWNKANGQVLNGLTFRRQTEATLFTTGELTFYNN